MIGDILGHYRILERVGRGGMGEVYRARDTRLERDVALKIIPEDATSKPERVARFKREAKVVAALRHPNIVTIHSVEEIDGRHCLTMELVEGKTLSDLIPPGGMPLDRLFEIAIPMADALSAAHQKGITHRDLKPSNVMVDADGRVKVLDFGMAKLFTTPDQEDDATLVADDSVTGEGKIVGTVHYMSPEQAEGKDLDHRSDIFSLGIVLYEMTTGQRPFAGDTPISTISAILKERPPPVTERKAALPRHLARIINRCLEKNPDKRFQTARDVCNELEGLQKEIESGELELSSSSISREALSAPVSSRRNLMPLVVGVAAVTIAALSYVAFFRGGEPAVDQIVTARPMTGLVGTEIPGSWSPDGGFFAYTHSAAGPLDIFVVSATGGNPIRLVESPHDDVSPRWSPDNRWIAFASNRDSKTAIYLIPPLGGSVQKLVETGHPPLSRALYSSLGTTPWSTDGRTLWFSRRGNDGTVAVWTIDLETRTEKQMTAPGENERDFGAAVSRDGNSVLFCRMRLDGARLLRMPASGGTPEQVHAAEEPLIAAWMPDGKRVVLDTNERGMWMLDIASGHRRQLTTGGSEGGAQVSATGKILYGSFSHQTDLYVQDLGAGTAKRLTRHTRDNFDAQMSPDGSSVAYMSSRTGNSEIWLLDHASGTERNLTNRAAEDRGPSWSPDGRWIVFVSDVDGPPSLWIVGVDGGALRKLADAARPMSGARWSPDGSRIGFLSRDGNEAALFVMPSEGGEPRKMLDRVAEFEWYGDTRRVIYRVSGTDSKTEMRAAHLETGRSVLLHDEPFLEIAVAPDGSAVSFVSALSHYNMNLHVLPLAPPATTDGLPTPSGPPQKITHGDGEWHVHNGSWSPDSQRVVYTRDTDSGDIFLLEGGTAGNPH